MDIRDFYKSTQEKQNQNTYANSANKQSTTTNPKQDFSEYQDTINKYKDLSQQDLYKELFNQADQLKAEGKLDQNMLNTLSNTLSPMLNDEQRELLNNLINRIK